MIPSRSPSTFFVQLVCELPVGMDLLSELLTALSKLLHEGLDILPSHGAL